LYSASSRYTRQNGVHFWLLPFFWTCIHAQIQYDPSICMLSLTHIYTRFLCAWCVYVCICVSCRECCVCELSMCVWETSTRLAYLYIIFRIPDSHAKRALNTQYGLLFVGGCANVRRSLPLARSLSFAHTQSFSVSFSLLPSSSQLLSQFSHCILDSKNFFSNPFVGCITRILSQ
jgi:hypothetical protein